MKVAFIVFLASLVAEVYHAASADPTCNLGGNAKDRLIPSNCMGQNCFVVKHHHVHRVPIRLQTSVSALGVPGKPRSE
jgi:hypothetical protein